MTIEKIRFNKEKETMLMMLSSKALQNQWKDPILRDPWSEEAIRHIDYDLSKAGLSGDRPSSCPVNMGGNCHADEKIPWRG